MSDRNLGERKHSVMRKSEKNTTHIWSVTMDRRKYGQRDKITSMTCCLEMRRVKRKEKITKEWSISVGQRYWD